MINRILDISEGGYFLSVVNRQLVIKRKDQADRSIPLSDIAILVVGTTWLTYTHSVLTGLAEAGAVAVFGDGRGMPVSMALPLYGHALQRQRLDQQIAASEPVKKRAWQQIVRLKIINQGRLLHHVCGSDYGLVARAKCVRSGDPDNIEGQSAKLYWSWLFHDIDFKRTPGGGEPPNHLLDYGYAVLRGIIARAICASALNPTLGLHHHNRDNSFCLADDLMEPFRPLIDHAVKKLVSQGRTAEPLNRETKGMLIEALLCKCVCMGEKRTLFDVATIMTASLARLFAGHSAKLSLPDHFNYPNG